MNLQKTAEPQPYLPNGSGGKRGVLRFGILSMLFIATAFNYADRAVLSVAAPVLQGDLALDPVTLGFIFSAFSWAYVLGQLPGGWLLDRFGSKRVYAASIILWSLFTGLQCGITGFGSAMALPLLFALRFLVGLAEAPSFPANGRIVAAWFPVTERGTASAVFNSAQYFAVVSFTPLMAWITAVWGWKVVFLLMGGAGVILGVIWLKVIDTPRQHRKLSRNEFEHIVQGGGLVDMDHGPKPAAAGPTWHQLRELVTNRMLWGVYLGQYCINTITYFFLTWFPVYLVQERGMSLLNAGFAAALPATFGFLGGVIGGILSDRLIKKGVSLTWARKTPIITGLLLSTTMVFCNVLENRWLVVATMSLAFFGKGLGALGWAVIADTSPREIIGMTGGIFNLFGNIAGITAPIVIGYILKRTGSFSIALVYVGANALLGVLSYSVIVKRIERVQLKGQAPS